MFKLRVEKAASIKTEDWKVEQVMKMCKTLKNNKARDGSGFIYELFKPSMAGEDMFKSLTMMFNMIKLEMKSPLFMEKMSITSLYKNKGAKNDFDNQRGFSTCLK